MARPAKVIAAKTGTITKAEEAARLQQEEVLRGRAEICAPDHLNEEQETVFWAIVNGLKESNILSGLDNYLLAQGAICIDRQQHMEQMINENPDLLFDKNFMNSKAKYSQEFFKFCSELCLSPQGRAKMANINVQAGQKQEDPLLAALSGDDD